MNAGKISRRTFLKTTGIVLAGTALVSAGINLLDHDQLDGSFPHYTFGENKMSEKILVTYASCTGSTAGVAEAIGKTLAQSGAQVDVLPMKDVKDVSSYRAVVAGSAIQAAKWLPEAIQFVKKNQTHLARKPFASFLVCMTLAMPKADQYRAHVASMMNPVNALVHPTSNGLFAGMLDTRKIPSLGDRIKFRLSVMMGVWTEGDHRDWKAIQSWAASLFPELV